MISYGYQPTVTLEDVHQVFARWLGDDYDTDALDIVLSAAAVERLNGDPVWLLVVSGSGNAKTETISALAGANAVISSTIASEGALLSATSRKETAKDATGGLLRSIGDRGILVLKDFTSILSMNRDQRAAVLAALREVYDGRWNRSVGTDGGRTLSWEGRIVLIGATTTAYDSHHGVIAAMGDRFTLIRMDSTTGRMAAGKQALRNVGDETEMRRELAEVVGGLIAGLDAQGAVLSDDTMDTLLAAADLVTLARTGVERDQRGDIIDAHAPEMPTRFAKMLAQIVRGGLALGIDEHHMINLALRVAADSMPPLRLLVLRDVAEHTGARTTEVSKRVQRPRQSVDRVLQELHILGVLSVETVDDGKGWHYQLAPGIDTTCLNPLESVPRKVSNPNLENLKGVFTTTDISGDEPSAQDSVTSVARLPTADDRVAVIKEWMTPVNDTRAEAEAYGRELRERYAGGAR